MPEHPSTAEADLDVPSASDLAAEEDFARLWNAAVRADFGRAVDKVVPGAAIQENGSTDELVIFTGRKVDDRGELRLLTQNEINNEPWLDDDEDVA